MCVFLWSVQAGGAGGRGTWATLRQPAQLCVPAQRFHMKVEQVHLSSLVVPPLGVGCCCWVFQGRRKTNGNADALLMLSTN